MCGIVGYIGHKEAFPILIKGLRRLEYRGYDSAGVALINDDNSLNVYKSKGKVDNLVEYCNDKNVSGTVGIAHTNLLHVMPIRTILSQRISLSSIMVLSRTMPN